MRKLLFFVASMFITGSLLAGGLVTNNNQSAMFARLQNRNASTNIDAVYYNPAGLTRLGDGFFASVNNQTINQTQKLISNYPFLSPTPKEYVGKVSAPIFPGVYVAYNTGNLSFSAGLNPIGGGGGAQYDKGLPSFEMMVADLVPALASQGIPTTQYAADIYFEGSSVYLGYQANVAYKISEMLSVAVGVRLVSAKNTYKGHIRGISVNPVMPSFGPQYNGSMVLASDFFTSGATVFNMLSAGSTQAAAGLTNVISGGVPSTTPLSAMPPATQAAVATLLGPAEISTAGMDIGTAAATLNMVAPGYLATANTMTTNAAKTQDINVDAKQTGTGITPIIGANFTPSDKFNISVRYEFQTKLDLETEVPENMGGGIFVDGTTVIADMPAELSLGVNYSPIKNLLISASFDEYFDKNVDYDGSESIDVNQIDKNFLQYGLGVEYALSEKLRLSTGWTHTSTGVNSNYQSDQSFSTNTNSFGAGFGYHISPVVDLNIGAQYTFYDEGSKSYNHMLGTNPIPVTETYNKSTWLIAAGLDFTFGKK
jgi:long-subunit fatty acid transport protein